MSCPHRIVLLAYGVYGCDLPEGHPGAPTTCWSKALEDEILDDMAGWFTLTITDTPPTEPPKPGSPPP